MISSKEMVTCLVFDVCLLTIAILSCGGLAFDETCANLEFEGLTNGDIDRLEQYSYINVTFHLNTSKCPDSGDLFRLKVSVLDGEGSVDVCMLFMKTQNCSHSDESSCQCLSAPRGWARMSRHLNVTGQVSIVWNNQGSSSSKVIASITFNVFEVDTSASQGNGDTTTETEEVTTVFQGDGKSENA
ncbi:uncharacterized protein LOC112568689 [Pomacea canaliculata]|uniref:uncharacterized protein LOC112568689 n=1 Tax=Pomacea canaliculata TaxID=400727 RepID=UPI000D73CAD8|nr:uncharacterized protein LOC112568689 [Pomacea canaliculata]XP_025101909.1 uncharacterized protein LOC112568689 [Pomacea canaliculata]XP_025101910.1 uncharacterized protein LOC112568689 [Pomacea canaliculata]XP_025101911.1 uncharacterized protein LOC112568689 [Pomacea canaliculata]